jgi:hypothetical protein
MKPSWQEQVEAVLSVHKNGLLRHGPAKKGRPRNGDSKGWGIRETAEELKLPIGKVCEDIAIALALEKRPELRLCVSREEALIRSRKVSD